MDSTTTTKKHNLPFPSKAVGISFRTAVTHTGALKQKELLVVRIEEKPLTVCGFYYRVQRFRLVISMIKKTTTKKTTTAV